MIKSFLSKCFYFLGFEAKIRLLLSTHLNYTTFFLLLQYLFAIKSKNKIAV